MGYNHLLINGVYWGYNPLTTLQGTNISPKALSSRWCSFSPGGICIRSLEGKLLPALPRGSANLARTAPVKMASSCFFSAALFTASIKSMTNGGAVLGHGFRASTSAFWSEPVPWFWVNFHMGSWMKQVTRNEFVTGRCGSSCLVSAILTVSLKLTVCKKGILKMETGVQFKTDWKQPLSGECEHDSFSFLSGCTIGTFEPQCWEKHVRWKNCLLAILDKILPDCWNSLLDVWCLFSETIQDFHPTTGAPPLGQVGQVTPSRMSHDISWTPSETRKIDGNVHHQYKRILWIPWWTWKATL